MSDPPEREESLWPLTIAPLIWAGHFFLSYLTFTLWCYKIVGRSGALGSARIAVAFYTLAALGGIAYMAYHGYTRHRFGPGMLPYDYDTPGDRHRFLGLATLLLAGLSAVATLFTALAVALIGECY